MVVGTRRAAVAPASTFYVPGQWGDRVELGEAAAHHAQVKRLSVGDPVRLTGGDGRLATGEIESAAKRRVVVALRPDDRSEVAAPPRLELWLPVGDRERMLLLAEKAVELGASAVRPVIYRRSRSVTPRGEGPAFREKLMARMISALEQSGGAWLPELAAECAMEPSLPSAAGGTRLMLDPAGTPLGEAAALLQAPVTLALGPEGGLQADERHAFLERGWRAVSLGANVLRFETAGIAALSIVRAFLR